MNALILLFYRIVTFFTRVPAKTRALNTAVLTPLLHDYSTDKSGFIDNQSDFHGIPYGKGTLSANGCGPIALYNALIQMNYDKLTLSSVIEFLEKKGATLYGKYGTSPYAINHFLKSKGFITKLYKGKSSIKLNKFSDKFEAFISLIYNDSGSLKKGLHFICTVKTSDCLFNTHKPFHTADSLYNALKLCSNDEILHVCTIGIKKNQT